jgi:hypothetical protein
MIETENPHLGAPNLFMPLSRGRLFQGRYE